ncbi:Hypothetical predicted protein [Pelobates cultripes]|uniref:Uncharacterized protein n=1 Tax=Pelobates cultripes TaxID=61616 RepID=A0AAD1W9X4_PELCU|nr:Hypothetical predicted protein [Pelobates cultripes]
MGGGKKEKRPHAIDRPTMPYSRRHAEAYQLPLDRRLRFRVGGHRIPTRPDGPTTIDICLKTAQLK